MDNESVRQIRATILACELVHFIENNRMLESEHAKSVFFGLYRSAYKTVCSDKYSHLLDLNLQSDEQAN